MSQVRLVKKGDTACKICGGDGFIYKPSGGKRNIEFLETCECTEKLCQCDKKPPYFFYDEQTGRLRECPCKKGRSALRKIHSLFRTSNIPIKYRYRRISEFEITKTNGSPDQSLSIATDAARLFLEDFNPSDLSEVRGMYFAGPTGTGKTMLACLILNEIILRFRTPVHYIKITRDFFNRIRSTFNTESDSYGRAESIFYQLADQQVLVIDDFGVQADSEWEKRTLYDLIDARYENQSPTIITSNVEPEDWQNLFNGRVFSRLQEMTHFYGMVPPDDYRNKYRSDQ